MTAVIKATGAIQEVYGIEAGARVLGSIGVRYFDDDTGAFISPAHDGRFIIHPEHQEHAFRLVNGVVVRETIFVLNDDSCRAQDGLAAVYLNIDFENATDRDVRLASYVLAMLRGDTTHDVAVEYDKELKGFLVWNEKAKDCVRTVTASRAPHSFETTLANSKASASVMPALTNTANAPQDPLGILRVDVSLPPNSQDSFYVLATVGTSKKVVRTACRKAPKAAGALSRTKSWFKRHQGVSVITTPDPHINQGVLWAKANMLRIETLTPTGWGFTNNPTKSSNTVARDTAWFGMGGDFLDPTFVRETLLAFLKRQEDSGMIVEYYDMRTGETDDYGLNINDNTPLLIMAIWHHYNFTGDIEFLRDVYPQVRKAGNYILSQRNDKGLVFCNATGTSGWGIVGWRNVIPNYRLSGATTELNSECYGALRDLSEMARVLEKHDDSSAFASEAAKLREAINTHLLDRASGVYLLNIDVDGCDHSEITSDLVFPLMFGVADKNTQIQVVSRLSTAKFWTDSGIRTVPRDAPNYSPRDGSGLLGGVWVGVSFWYAFAVASSSPEYMAHALSRSFQTYSVDPSRSNTVPGQFSEWLDGETLVNQGMMLSPWYPPRYLWAAVEGMAGLGVEAGEAAIEPRMPAQWKWMAAQNVPFRGSRLTWLVVRAPELQLFTTFASNSRSLETSRFSEDISDQVEMSGESSLAVALRHTNRILLFVGNTLDESVTDYIGLNSGAVEDGGYRLRRFESLLSSWETVEDLLSADDLRKGFSVVVERKGFVLLDLRLEV